jgi:hypothetical protein
MIKESREYMTSRQATPRVAIVLRLVLYMIVLVAVLGWWSPPVTVLNTVAVVLVLLASFVVIELLVMRPVVSRFNRS